ncbi:ROK family protein [Streptomyces capparidis]
MAAGLYLVADVGGTSLRTGWAEPGAAVVRGVRREAVQGAERCPGTPVAALQERVVAQLVRALREQARRAPRPVTAVCVAFAGPVDGRGRVTGAPTVWGPHGAVVALGDVVAGELGVPVRVLNDVTAAGWRYVDGADGGEDFFCMVTVSSGVGNKVFRRGEVLVPEDGQGGEIGHLRVDRSPSAPRCDCGGRGHLGAVASGRGALACARALAVRHPVAFARSALCRAGGGDPAALGAPDVADAVRRGDPFALRAVGPGLGHLAWALSGVHAALGVRRFIVMGGFARAAGPVYLARLGEALREVGCFGVRPEDVAGMLCAAEPDDDHGLIGCVRHLDRHPPAAAPRGVPSWAEWAP